MGGHTIAPRWLMAFILVIRKAFSMTYRQMALWLSEPYTYHMLKEHGLRAIPSYLTLHHYFINLDKSTGERLLKKLAIEVLDPNKLVVAVDGQYGRGAWRGRLVAFCEVG